MTDTHYSYDRSAYGAGTWAALPPEALAGVRSRRILAVCLDLIAVAIMASVLWIVLLVLTLGFALALLPPLFPTIAFFYNGLTVAGWRHATPGMKALDLELRRTDGIPVSFLQAAAHAVLFYLSWFFPPILLVSLVATDKRCLHDMIAGVVVVRRPLA